MLGAAPFAKWYGEPQLASLIPIAALAALISGFSSSRLFTASRKLAVARVTLVDFAGQSDWTVRGRAAGEGFVFDRGLINASDARNWAVGDSTFNYQASTVTTDPPSA